MDFIRDPATRCAGTRLATLRGLPFLDSRPEPEFDRIARLAARLLHAPIALVTLVDEDRQWFKSGIGLPEPWASVRETPLSHSICRHVVARGETLAINDARRHPLVCDCPAIAELGVVAYLGSPLRIQDGHVLGALCVIDARPREWAMEEGGLLDDLAGWVTAEIERRSRAMERRRVEEELAAAVSRHQAVSELLEQTRQAKRQFVSFLTHESEMIRDEALSAAEIKEYAADIHQEASRLADIITRLRDSSRAETVTEI